MNEEKLSDIYFRATSSMSDVGTAVYEYLHDDKGSPQTIYNEELEKRLRAYMAEIRNHFDFIKEALKEYNEAK
jgi:hypothetical protein